MRILHVTPSVGLSRGGPSFVLRTLVRGLAQQGASVEVVSTDDDGTARLRVPLDGPILENGATYRFFRRQTSFYNCSLPMLVWLRAHVRDYDIIHVHAVFSWASTVGSRLAFKNNVPYLVRPLGVLNEWGMQNRRPWLKRVSFRCIERAALEHAAAVHYTSARERDEAERLSFSGRAVIIPNPVDLADAEASPEPFRARYPQLKDKLVILFMSRLDPKKGLDLLIPAFRMVRAKHSEAILVIAGSGNREFSKALRRQAGEENVDAHIVWTGFLDGAAKKEALDNADIFVLPSYSENFGVAAVEAMAHGVPVVISDQVAVHTQVAEYSAGVVTACDPKQLAQALSRLVSDPAERLAMGAQGLSLAREQFSTDTVCRSLIKVYESILRVRAA